MGKRSGIEAVEKTQKLGPKPGQALEPCAKASQRADGAGAAHLAAGPGPRRELVAERVRGGQRPQALVRGQPGGAVLTRLNHGFPHRHLFRVKCSMYFALLSYKVPGGQVQNTKLV